MPKPIVICALALTFWVSPHFLFGVEPDAQHRTAELLYSAGNYKESSDEADSILKYFPNDLQALIIKGKSEFYQEHYLEAGKAFFKAAKKDPNNAVVREYAKLLREIYYKLGLEAGVSPKQPVDKSAVGQAEYFKRGYFGTNFPVLSGMALTRSKTAPTTLKTPYPSQKITLLEKRIEDLANKALSEGNYSKAYLFFGQLLATEPSNSTFILGRAEAAFYTKRFKSVIKLLSPELAKKNSNVFSPEQQKKAETLLSNARKIAYSD